jgi:predicted phosphodiesterase
MVSEQSYILMEERTMIYFLGDVHGNFEHARERVLADRPQAIIFLGDIEAQRPFELEIAPLLEAGIDVRWIHGNHDSDTRKNWDNLAGAMHLNIDGKVVELAGQTIAGLGGIFRGEVWYPDRASAAGPEPQFDSYDDYRRAQEKKRPLRLRKTEAIEASLRSIEFLPGANAAMIDEIRYGKELKHLSSIFWNTYERMWEQKADILVTHEAPSCHPNGFAAIDELAQAMNVKAVFHGHHHDCLDYRAWDDKLGFRAYGVGFCGIMDEAGKVIQAGDFDEARRYRQQHPYG